MTFFMFIFIDVVFCKVQKLRYLSLTFNNVLKISIQRLFIIFQNNDMSIYTPYQYLISIGTHPTIKIIVKVYICVLRLSV